MKYHPSIILFVLLFLLLACTSTTEPLPASIPAPLMMSPTAVSQITAVSTPTLSPNVSTPTLTATPSASPSTLPTETPALLVMPSVSPTPPCPPGEMVSGTISSNLAGETNYRVYLPPCYGRDGRAYPTLYLFGGNAQNDSAWDNYGLDEAAEIAMQNGTMPPMLLVMVDGGWLANNSSGGPTSFEGHFLNDIIPAIEQTYCTWNSADGRALAGISRGGYWSLMIAFRRPELFASVGGHSPALIDSHADETENPQFTGINNDLTDLRIYIDIGDNDYLRPNAQRLHEDMERQGIPHSWHLNEGAHEDSYWPPHLNEYLLWYAKAWPPDRNSYPERQCP